MAVPDTAPPAALAADTDALDVPDSMGLAMLSAGVATFGFLYYPQPLLPAMAEDLHVSASAASLAVSVSTAGVALSVFALTDLAERVGRVRLMRLALVMATAATLATVAATELWQVLLLRIVVGVTIGGVVGTAVGHLADQTPADRIGRVMGRYIAGTCLGGVLGRIVPGVVVDAFSWRYATMAVAAICIVAVVSFWCTLPPYLRPTTVVERRESFAVTVMRLLRNPAMRRLCLIGLILMGVYVACFNVLVFRLSDAPFHLAVGTISALFLLSSTGVVSSPVAGHLADRLGQRLTLVSCITVAIVGLLLMTEDRFWAVTLGLGVTTSSFFAAHGVATGWVSLVAGTARAQGAALYLSAYYTGAAVLGTLLVHTYEWGGWPTTAGAMAALLIAGIACALTVDAGWSPSTPAEPAEAISATRRARSTSPGP